MFIRKQNIIVHENTNCHPYIIPMLLNVTSSYKMSCFSEKKNPLFVGIQIVTIYKNVWWQCLKRAQSVTVYENVRWHFMRLIRRILILIMTMTLFTRINTDTAHDWGTFQEIEYCYWSWQRYFSREWIPTLIMKEILFMRMNTDTRIL